jgi:hypothetical protein
MSVKRLISVILVSVAFCLIFNVAKAATAEELLKEIARLQALIAQLQKQLAEIQGKPAVWCHDFNVNLKIGDSGSEVEALQTALTKEGFNVGGDTPGEFGEYTASAVVGFQEKYKDEILIPWGLTHGTGFVGKTTRAKLNKLYGCGVVPPPEKPYIKVLSPNGGEKWQIGQTYEIKWVASGLSSVGINICNEELNLCTGITENVSAGIGSYSWTIPSSLAVGDKYKIIIGGEKVNDMSDNYFSIVSTPAACTDSDGGRNYYTKGTTIDPDTGKSFTDYCLSDSILREYFCLSPSSVFPKGSVGQEDYTCPYGCKDGACIREKSITVVSPNGGEKWVFNTPQTIVWNSTGIDKVVIYLWFPDGATCKLADNITASDGKYTITIKENQQCPNIPRTITAGQYKIGVWSVEPAMDISAPHDYSDDYFSIVLVEGLVDGYNHYCFTLSDIKIGTTINFDYTSIDDPYLRYFMISIDCPEAQGKRWYTSSGCSSAGCSTGKYCNIGVGYSGRYSYTFGSALPGSHQICTWPTSDHEPGQTYVYKWKVEKSIIQPTITVNYPNGGERWIFGVPQTIKWTSSGIEKGKTIGLYLMSTENLACLIGEVDVSAGEYTVTLQENQSCPNPYFPKLIPGKYKLSIDAAAATGIENFGDDSDDYFTIVESDIVDGYNHGCFTFSDIPAGLVLGFNYTSIDDPYLRYFMIGIDCPEANGKRWYTSSGCVQCSGGGKYCNIGTGYSGTYYYTFSSSLAGQHTICTWPSSDYKPELTDIYKWKVKMSSGSGLGFIGEQLASISQAASWLTEQLKKMIGR